MSNRNKANRPGTLLGNTNLATTTATQDPTTEPEELLQDPSSSPDQDTSPQDTTEVPQDSNPVDNSPVDSLSQDSTEAVKDLDTDLDQPKETTTEQPKPLTEQEQATEINKALALSQPAIKLEDSPVTQDPVEVAVSKKEATAGRELGYVPDVREASFGDIVEQASQSNKINAMITSEQLQIYVKRFSPQTASSVDQAAKDMSALYSFLLNLLNTDKSVEEFNTQWRLVTETFKAHQGNELSEARLYRGTQHWPLSHEDMKLYQSILNLIRVGNTYSNAEIQKQVNFRNFEMLALSDQGRGRLMQYYS